MSESDPTAQEVQQTEEQTETVPFRDLPVEVAVKGPVRSQTAGARVGVSRSFSLTTTAEVILGSDPRRRRAVLISSATVRFGDRTDVDNDMAFRLPPGMPFEITHIDQVWARSDTGSAVLSLLVENWTE